jgi:Cu(I)/Ag(I) efflux system membrane fusion protein
VQLSPQRVQLAGIQTSEIELRPLSHQVRTVGNVAFDESRLSRVVTRVGGYVEKLHVNKSFTEVRQGEPLAELYSPDLYAAEQELLLVERSGNAELTAAGREKLRLLGMDGRDVDEMLRSGKASYRQVLRAPHTGHVIRKEVVEGDRVEPGMMLFEVADLSVAWIEAEVYEKDIAAMRSGTPIAATVEALPDRTFSGKVALVHPHVEAATRTNRVRFEVDNPGHALRPGMYATVRLETPIVEMEPFRTRLAELASGPQGDDDAALVAFQKLCPVQGSRLGSMGKPIRATAAGQSVMLCCKGCQDDLAKRPQYYLSRLKTLTADSVLAVPQQAVIDTGERKIVYVQRHPDTFEGVEVRLGPRSGEYYAVAEGLLAGDRVASAGAFLVDAETRLNPAAASAYFGATGGPQPGSSTGNATGSSPGAAVSAVDGESNIKQGTNTATRPSAAADRAGAKTASAKKIRDNLAKLSDADRKAALAQGVCPVTHKQLGSMGVPVKVTIKNRTVFLCCDGCEAQATGDPAATLREIDRKRLPK